ncbi:MAG: hypothetical protein J0H82_27030 [Alphaproteobacteria bacterium]|nr:hypothetical protein [Alphaproteobacteria bacterium]
MLAVSLLVGTSACATDTKSSAYDKPGFTTKVVDGRLWVFRSDSKELQNFEKGVEPSQLVTRIAAGPGGMTLKSPDAKILDEYLAK